MSADVIIFYGPPHCGKSLYYTQHLKETHDRLCPSIELLRHPTLTLRQLILTRIIAPLKQGKKIVIDDENGTFTKRDSYICLVKKKLPDRTVVCLAFSPQHGQPQLLWSREFSLAARVENNADTSGFCHLAEGSCAIEKWMNDKSSLDPPRMTEGYEAINEIKSQFHVEVRYKFEWPCLLIQWEALVRGPGLDSLAIVSGAAETVTVWSQQNPAGRVVIVVDHAAFDTGTLADRNIAIQTILKSLTKLVSTVGVYAIHVCDVSRSGAFSAPPAPGLVAFLQRLLDLQLTHKASVYAYHTPPHMRMAEQAGIKHIKASRLFNRPALAKGSHAFTTVPIPTLLKHLKVVPEEVLDTAATAEPSLPLSEPSLPATSYYEASVAPFVKQRDMGCGRILYLAAQNRTVFEKYAELCVTHATPASVEDEAQSVSELAPSTIEHTADREVATPRVAIQRQDSVQRDLPKWMKPKENIKSEGKRKTPRDYKPKLKTLTSGTMYIMTSEELLATARHILAEGLESADNQETIIQAQPTSTQKPSNSNKFVSDVAAEHTHVEPDKTVSISNIDPAKVKNSNVNKSHHKHSAEIKPTLQQDRIGVTQDTFRYSNILDDLFDDEEYGRERRPAPSSSTQRHRKGRQSHIDEFLSPSKRKKACEKRESPFHSTKVSPNAKTPTKQVKLERYASRKADSNISATHRPGKMENLSPPRTDTRTRSVIPFDTIPVKSENFASRGFGANSRSDLQATSRPKSDFFTTRTDARNNFTSMATRKPIKSENFFSVGSDTASSSFTTKPIKSEHYVPDTTSVEVQDNSIIFMDTQEDSLEVSNSMSQEQDSLVVYDSDDDTEGRGGTSAAYTNLKQRKTSRRQYSVTTVQETTDSRQKSYY